MAEKKRKRRTLKEIRVIREGLLKTVNAAETVTLSQLVSDHGSTIGVRNTPSDKNLVKKQLDRLAKSGQIEFVKVGRDLVARTPSASSQEGELALASSNGRPNLAVIRSYAILLEEVAKTLQGQIRTLIRMVEKATEGEGG